MDAVFDALTEGVLVVDETHTVTAANAAARDLLNRDDPVGADVREVLPRSVEATFHETFDNPKLEPASLSFEEYFPQLEHWLHVRTVPLDAESRTDTTGRLVVTLESIADRRDYEERLQARTRELETLTRIIGIVETIVQRLTQASDQSAIENYVCEQLVDADLYDLAWIGGREVAGDIERRSAAGMASEEFVDTVLDAAGDPRTGLEQRALESGRTQVTHPVTEADDIPEAVRRIAFARGFQSGLAIPFVYGDTTYGVLGVYTTRSGAFQEAERDGFEALGTAIGYGINAIKQERLLLSETTVELTFGVRPDDGFLARIATELDTELRVRGLVPGAGAECTAFVEFDRGAADTVLEMTDDAATVESARVVHDNEAGGVVELDLVEGALLTMLVAHGGTVRTAEFTPDGGSVVTEFAPSDDLTAVVETITEAFDGVELVSKRDREATVETAGEFKTELRNQLTDRQETVLRTSYLADYFENPRGSTGEEIAESLGVSSPTFHHHLRAALRKLLRTFFEEMDDTSRDVTREGRDRDAP